MLQIHFSSNKKKISHDKWLCYNLKYKQNYAENNKSVLNSSTNLMFRWKSAQNGKTCSIYKIKVSK